MHLGLAIKRLYSVYFAGLMVKFHFLTQTCHLRVFNLNLGINRWTFFFFCTFSWCCSCFEYWCNYFVNNFVFLICLCCFAWRAGGWQQSIICAELVSEQQSVGESDLIRKEEPTWLNRGWILNWGMSLGPPGNSAGLGQGGGFAFWSQKLNCRF